MFNPCAVIPVYNHHLSVPTTTKAVLPYLPVILVDDGSCDDCKIVMQQLCQKYNQVTLVTRESNGGKGAAVKTGLIAAGRACYSHVLQIDADGQHDTSDIPCFIKLAQEQPTALINGVPKYDASIPKSRLYGRYLTHIWVWINTLSLDITDSMCGFRVYPLAAALELLKHNAMGDRMDFDSEFIVRWHWANAPIREIKTRVTYPADGVSHFNAWRDNKIISWMHARLFFGMLIRSPKLLFRKLSK